MPTLNLLAEVLVAEDELNRAQLKIDHRREIPLIGKLPIVRSRLGRRQLKIDADRIRIEAAKKYLTPTE